MSAFRNPDNRDSAVHGAGLLPLLFCACSLVFAAPPPLPAELVSAWTRFQQALRADDPDALSQVTRFPLRSNEFGGDISTPSALREKYQTLFPQKTRQCLLAASLKRRHYDKGTYYDVFCDVGPYPIRFIFEQAGSRYYFTSIDNVNE